VQTWHVGVLPRDLAVSESLSSDRLPAEDPHHKFHGPRDNLPHVWDSYTT